MMFVLLLLSIMFPFRPAPPPNVSYLCVGEQAAGFTMNKTTHQWSAAILSNRPKYIVSHILKGTGSDSAGFHWQVKEVGHSIALIMCKQDFDAEGDIACEGWFKSIFNMNKYGLRFQYITPGGYWNFGSGIPRDTVGPNKEFVRGVYREGGAPFMVIGKCSPIEQ